MGYLLVVDDNEDLLFALKEVFKTGGYRVFTATTLSDASDILNERNYDLILLDWMLPDGSGVEWLNRIRETGVATPVLLFSSRSEVEDKVNALDKGADDYLPKPFSNIELLARVRALIRRGSTLKNEAVKIDDIEIDLKYRSVKVCGESVELSAKEFELLELLVRNRGVVLTRYQLFEHIHRDFNKISSSNVVDVHIKNIRKKIRNSALIKTVRGVGYTIEGE